MPISSASDAFTHLRPDAAILLATAGICLGLVEINRPGRVLPGALGLLAMLFSTASLLRFGLRPGAVLLLVLAAVVMVANAWWELPRVLLALATAAGIAGLRLLIRPPAPPVHIGPAILCGAILGALSATLTRIAFRARRAKALD